MAREDKAAASKWVGFNAKMMEVMALIRNRSSDKSDKSVTNTRARATTVVNADCTERQSITLDDALATAHVFDSLGTAILYPTPTGRPSRMPASTVTWWSAPLSTPGPR